MCLRLPNHTHCTRPHDRWLFSISWSLPRPPSTMSEQPLSTKSLKNALFAELKPSSRVRVDSARVDTLHMRSMGQLGPSPRWSKTIKLFPELIINSGLAELIFSAPDYSFGWLLPRSALKQLGKIDHWRIFASRFSFFCIVLKLFPFNCQKFYAGIINIKLQPNRFQSIIFNCIIFYKGILKF